MSKKIKKKHRPKRPNSSTLNQQIDKALTLYSNNRLKEASSLCQSVLAKKPYHAHANHLLGIIKFKSGDANTAIDLIAKALATDPNVTIFNNTMGVFLDHTGQHAQAVEFYQKVISAEPHNTLALNNLATTLQKLQRFDEAQSLLTESLRIKPDNPVTLKILGDTMHDLGDIQGALTCFQKSLALNPNYMEVYVSLGILYEAKGDAAAAQDHYLKAIQLNPACATAYCYLADLRGFEADDAYLSAMETLKSTPLPVSERMQVFQGLGKMYEKAGQYDNAFANYKGANEIRKTLKGRDFSIQQFTEMIEQLQSVFDQDFFARHAALGIETEVPVFIVGMPRSGTTLVEQIISAHPQAFGAGELDHIKNLRIRLQPEIVTFLTTNTMIPQPQIEEAANEYLNALQRLAPDAIRIIDKMPQNFLHLWLICLMFRKPRIIHCCRTPLDTCLSCYFTDFTGEHGYKNDLRTLGQYYTLYQHLMQHWQAVLPAPILDVHYEELVAEQEKISRRIIEFCNLDWDERCLSFHTADSHVRTASNAQVRQKIYRSSLNRWEKYQAHLGPLIESLNA